MPVLYTHGNGALKWTALLLIHADGMVELQSESKQLSFEFATRVIVRFNIDAEEKPGLRKRFNELFNGLSTAPMDEPGTPFHAALQAKASVSEDIKRIIARR